VELEVKGGVCRLQGIMQVDNGEWEVTGAICCPSVVYMAPMTSDPIAAALLPHKGS